MRALLTTGKGLEPAALQSVPETPSIRAQARKLADEIAALPTIESAVDQLLEMA